MSANSKPVPNSDYEAIVAAEQAYINGLRTGDAEASVASFKEGAPMIGYIQGEYSDGQAASLRDFVVAQGASASLTARVDVLAITPTTASVRVDLEGLYGDDCTDFHLLVKQDGNWVIAAKTYELYAG